MRNATIRTRSDGSYTGREYVLIDEHGLMIFNAECIYYVIDYAKKHGYSISNIDEFINLQGEEES